MKPDNFLPSNIYFSLIIIIITTIYMAQ